MPRCAQKQSLVRIGAAITLALALPGCASTRETVGGWFEPTPSSETATQQSAYYVGSEALKVYAEPSSSSTLVGTLSLHEKVTRSKLERGYAHVKSATSGMSGWVNNADLIWRLPAATKAAAPAPAETQPEEPATPADPRPEDAAAPPEARPANVEAQPPQEPAAAAEAAQPSAPSEPRPAAGAESPPSGATPSVFDAY